MIVKNNILLIIALLSITSGIHAQTGGPGQPEFMQFKPATATDLVNPATGSFSYNIPLFDVGGYPINLSYQSGISMEDVASTVGLGWNINVGAVNHQMRGLPDDFKGDVVKRTIYMKDNITYGGNVDAGLEIAGLNIGVGLNIGFGIFYNNYNGYGCEESFGLSLSMHKEGCPVTGSIGIGMKANSQSGVDIYANPSVAMKSKDNGDISATGSLGGSISINSREGLKGSVNASMNISQNTGQSHKSGYLKQKDGKTTYETKESDLTASLASSSASYSFSKTPEIPRVTYPFIAESYSGSFTIGGEIFFLHPHGSLKGYYSSQKLGTNHIHSPAYGFLYADRVPSGNPNVLQDFSREKDIPYIKDASINIGIPYYTNDIYTVNAQGVGGSFQLNRSDIGVVFDNQVVTSGNALNIGADVGLGNATHVGATISTTNNFSMTGKWSSAITPALAFKSTETNKVYQAAYFKNASDVSVDEEDFFGKHNRDLAIKVKIEATNSSEKFVGAEAQLVNNNNDNLGNVYNNSNKTKRDPRTINIQYLDAGQAATLGVEKKVFHYPVNKFYCQEAPIDSNRLAVAMGQAHHISEMTATNTDGMRYIFGLPTYNITQKEVAFTLEKDQNPTNDGLISYDPATIQSGTNGKDGFYESTELPPYVTSHLLTAVLSPEYIDVDNNGPSLNDVGNYVKMNYCYAGTYNWRTPYAENKATFNKAFLSDDQDDKASYVYGQKQHFYIHSIESKTEVAEFYYDTNGRRDALQVKGEHGGKYMAPNHRLYKLDSIKVYSTNERILKGASAEPIRIIYFSFDYELCDGIDNSADGTGKLTLKKVAFASGKSNRELLSPYKFSYGKIPDVADSMNPPYAPRNVNRFGNYQVNTGTSDININTALSNIDFPYASQDKAEMTKNAYAWNLTTIKLPSSGTIKVEYEPHSYAYTQDKRCMQMFQLTGGGDLSNINDEIEFKLQDPILGNNGYEQLKLKYFGNDLDQYYYYKTLVNLKSGFQEWISGYCKIKSIGLRGSGPPYNAAFITLTPVCRGDGNDDCGTPANPIAKNAWQFMRMNRQELCFGDAGVTSGMGLESFIRSNPMEQARDQIHAFFIGFNDYAVEENFATTLDPSKSFIRLYSPNKNKIIGGSRVKRVITDDNWQHQTQTASPSKSYTTDYEYTDIETNPVTEKSDTVSTGVMEYEPFNGQDENPMRLPVYINQNITMAPDNRLYIETPINESLFPGSNLMYSKVRIISNKTDLNIPGTGYQETECYTAKDYPVLTDYTYLGDNHEKKTDLLGSIAMSILGVVELYDFITLSQGFSITLNDMHGKQKATKNYNTHGAMISSEKFEYSLGNTLNLINHDNTIYQSDKLGVSASAICDSRHTGHSTRATGVNLNFDLAMAAIIPLLCVVPLPNTSIEETSLNTVAMNKLNYKKGILTKKTVMENAASVSTENLLFDDKTGSVVLTKTTNEFNDTLFKFTYPAHWIYDGLSAGYVSSDLEFTCAPTTPTNHFSIPNADIFNALTVGDKILSGGATYWIMSKLSAGFKIKIESDILGNPVTLNSLCRVLRPGRRNLLTLEAGSVVTHKNPIVGNKIVFAETKTNLYSRFYSDAKVINASMQEFADQRVRYCSCDSVVHPEGCIPTTPPRIVGNTGTVPPIINTDPTDPTETSAPVSPINPTREKK